jgi:rhodanese-related sulfurtransferase
MERIQLKIRKLLFPLVLLFFVACQSKAQQEDSYRLLDNKEFKTELVKENAPQLIDVRTPEEFKAGSIEGALNYNLLDGSLEAAMGQLDPEKTVYVFCAKGGRSARAARKLEAKGFKVVDLKGGYSNWK